MILSHFSDGSFVFDQSRKYKNDYIDGYPMKPFGLWLSDEDERSEVSWREWCQSEQFSLDRLKQRTDFSVDLSDVLHLKNRKEIVDFTFEYQKENSPFRFLVSIEWSRVTDEYKGLLITPYCWEARLDITWYYGWDCASGCFWDLSCLKLIKP